MADRRVALRTVGLVVAIVNTWANVMYQIGLMVGGACVQFGARFDPRALTVECGNQTLYLSTGELTYRCGLDVASRAALGRIGGWR